MINMAVENVTGWNELMDGKLIKSAFTMYDTSFVGWFVPIIFFTFEALLYMKTKNVTITWVSGLLFASLYASSAFMNEASQYILFITLAIQLAGVFYMIFVGR
ncbi:MAG: hypothetical protein ACOCZ5_01515 [bacterium]